MDKQQIISFIEAQIAEGHISRGDLLTMAGGAIVANTPAPAPVPILQNSSVTAPTEHKEDASKKLINVFYAIGGIIVIIGIIILVGQNWDDIGFAGRVLVTLGISFVTYVAGYLFGKPEQNVISQVMFTLSAILAPFGSFILLAEADIDMDLDIMIMIAVALFIIYTTAFFITKRSILYLISIGFASWAYYGIIIKALENVLYDSNVLQWATMLLGITYILLGYGYKSISHPRDISDDNEKNAMRGILTAVGTLGILGAGISIGGVFDIVFIAFIFGAFYGSVYLKNRAMLILGAFFLMGHIIKLTSEYFVDSIGWPIALIAIGFLVIGVGYMTFYLNKKFISKRTA